MNLTKTREQNLPNTSSSALSCCEQPSLVPDEVAHQSNVTPDAIAIESTYGSLTYRQLNTRADELTHALIRLGIKPNDAVALCLKRSPAMVVGALAVLKAGGAYLPLNPSDPAQRLGFLLEDASANILITTKETRWDTGSSPGHVLYVDEQGRLLESEKLDQPSKMRRPVTFSDLAYVIYTSGSTGQPKGVEITHEGLSNLVQWHRTNFNVSCRDRATQLARIVFDAAVWEVWPYLTCGASIHLTPDELINDPEALRDWLVNKGITITFIPTPMAERLLSLPWPAKTALRALLTGGDVLHRSPPAHLPFALINNYGPTECAVVATSCLVAPNGSTEHMPPIGTPIHNTRVHILDPSLHPVPAGTPGELYIGGPGVARGYRNRPGLTEERFIADPFNQSQRLFRTGDLVQSLPDGQLAFLGRVDEQIKIRGFRIEPHEIITALDAHPAIAQSTVIAQEIAGEERRLAAYFVSNNGSEVTLKELRDFLSSRLSDYMVPAVFVKLEALPLTPNGKIDRAALPIANETNILRDEIQTHPESDLEKAVAGILAPLLGVPQVDLNANFFSLGGHSLLGTQLIARLRDAFGVDLPLRSVFEAPTVAGLAAEIDRLLLAKLESMSDAEAERLLGSGQSAYAVSA
jgi:amino acid adenylation domain-containing protein